MSDDNLGSPSNNFTSVGIVGLDYCGSTLINNILSGLPNCIGAGETHWIVDRVKNPNQTGRCTECYNQECPVFSDKVLEKLQTLSISGNGNWWQEIGKSANKNIVISGDKRPHHYDRFGVPDKLLFVVKDPRSHIVSWARRKFLPPDQTMEKYNQGNAEFTLTDEQFNEAINVWLRDTRKHISWCLETGKDLLVISLESFVQYEKYSLQKISEWLKIDCAFEALEYWNSDLHYIGSNHSVKRLKKERYFFKQLKKDKRWKSVLTQSQAEKISANEKVHYQLNRLNPYVLDKHEFFK